MFGANAQSSTPSLFGNTPAAAPAQSGGLFGGANTSTPAASGGLFGGAASTTPATPAGGLFGNKPPPISTGAANSLFGGPTATTSAPAGGMFGGAATTSAPAAGGLFGGGATATPAVTTGGLFGAPAAAPAAASGGLFGGAQTAAPAATTAPATGGLFGGAPAAKPAGTGMFGGAPAATTTPSTGQFGATQPAATGGLFGATPAANTTTTTNTVPAATIDISRLTPTTRFGDCHLSIQQELQQIESEIQAQITLSASLADRFPAHRTALDTIPTDASILAHRLATTKLFQSSDNAALAQVRALHDADDAASTLSIRTLDLFRLPHAQRSQYIARTIDRESGADVTSNKPMLKYFGDQADGMEKRLDVVVRSVREVEASLRSVEVQAAQGAQGAGVMGRDLTAVTGGVGGRQDARRLNRTLREFNEALKDVSGRILDARDSLAVIEGR